MADNARGRGLRYVGTRGYPAPTPERVRVATAYQGSVAPGPVSVDLCVGDPVVKVTDGTVAHWASGAIYGVVCNILPYWDSGEGVMKAGKQLPGGTAYGTNYSRESIVEIIPAANVLFEMDCDDAVTATTYAAYRAFIHENAQMVYEPDSNTRQANPVLDISTHAVTNTLPLRIVDISKVPVQDFTGKYVKLIVTANLVQQAPWTPLGV